MAKKNEVVKARVTREEGRAIRRAAREAGVMVSEFVRETLNEKTAIRRGDVPPSTKREA